MQKLKLFKETFWQAFKYKIQILSLIILTLMLTVIITVTWTTITRVTTSQKFMNNNQNIHFNYVSNFNAKKKHLDNKIITFSPIFDIFNNYQTTNVSEIIVWKKSDNSKNIVKSELKFSTPLIKIGPSTKFDNIKPLTPKNLDFVETTDDENNSVTKVKFKDILKWDQIYYESQDFENSLFGQILREKYQKNIYSTEFQKLYDQYRVLVEKKINQVVEGYLTKMYKKFKNKMDPNIQNFINDYINPSKTLWNRNHITDETDLWINNIALNDDENDKDYISKDDYREFYETKYKEHYKDMNGNEILKKIAGDYDNRAFLKNGFKGTIGGYLLQKSQDSESYRTSLSPLKTSDKNTKYLNVELLGAQTQGEEWQDIYQLWKKHTQLVGIISNFDVEMRSEYIYSDYTKKNKYRIVNYDDQKNLRIIQGKKPEAPNQIAISSQFAYANKYKVGDFLKIGAYNLLIVGIGGDSFTILPIVNNITYIPNPKSEGIIFVHPNIFINDKLAKDSDIEEWSSLYLAHNGLNNSTDIKRWNLFINDKNAYNSNYIEIISKKQEAYKNNPNDINEIVKDNEQLSVTKIQDINEYLYLSRGYSSLNDFLWVYIVFTILISSLTLLLVLFSSTLIIKKAIERDSNKIWILSALGYKKWTLIMSYWAYPAITALFSLPLGWLIGIGLQMPIMSIFNSFFILEYNVINFDLWPLLISYTIIGILTISVSSITAYLKISDFGKTTNKHTPARLIDGTWSNRFYNHTFGKLSFKIRFKWIFATVSYKKIITMFITIMFSTLAIGMSFMLPAIVKSLENSYYKFLNYQTRIDFNSPVSNMPLSKFALSPWQGIDGASDDPNYPISENKPISDYILNEITNDWEKTIESKNITASKILNQLIFNFYWNNGRAITPGWIEYIVTQVKDKNIANLIANITIPIIKQLLPDAPDPKSTDWKERLNELFSGNYPSYVRENLQDPKRKKRFAIGWNTMVYNKEEDELYTYFDTLANKKVVRTYGIKPNTKMINFGKNSTKLDNTYLDQNGSTIIPVIINKPMALSHNLQIDNTIKFQPIDRKLQYHSNNNKWYTVPKQWWKYDPHNNNEDIYEMSMDKWTLHNGPDKFGYKNKYNNNSKIEEYKNINDAILILPINDVTIYNKELGKNVQYPGLSSDINTFLENINTMKIPTVAENKYVVEKKNGWWILRAYAPYASNTNYVTKRILQESPLDLLVAAPERKILALINTIINKEKIIDTITPEFLKVNNRQEALINNPEDQDFSNNYIYKVIAIHESYNEPSIFINQKFANNILQYNDKIIKDTPHFKNTDQFNEELNWFNGRFSTNPIATDVNTRFSMSQINGDYTLNGSSGYSVSSVKSPDLLSIKKALIGQLTSLSVSLASLFIIASITISILIIIMISNFLLHQLAKMMALLKILGYSNNEINNTIWTVFALPLILGFTIGFIGAWFLTKLLIYALGTLTGFILPVYFQWWLLLATLTLIALIFSLTFILSTINLKKMRILELVTTSQE